MTQIEINELCLSIYAETRAFTPIRELCASQDRPTGFEVLMGPPFKSAPLAFIGYQPGDWKTGPEEARAKGYENCWVTSRCQYVTESWLLARRIQTMFPPEILNRSVGLNAIFVRAKNVGRYEAQVPKDVRRLIKDYCLRQVKRILDAIEPQKIVVVGFSTMDLFGPTEAIPSDSGRKMLGVGKVFGRPAFVTPHLTGARGYSNADRKGIAKKILATSP
jgi:hypothetical protein